MFVCVNLDHEALTAMDIHHDESWIWMSFWLTGLVLSVLCSCLAFCWCCGRESGGGVTEATGERTLLIGPAGGRRPQLTYSLVGSRHQPVPPSLAQAYNLPPHTKTTRAHIIPQSGPGCTNAALPTSNTSKYGPGTSHVHTNNRIRNKDVTSDVISDGSFHTSQEKLVTSGDLTLCSEGHTSSAFDDSAVCGTPPGEEIQLHCYNTHTNR